MGFERDEDEGPRKSWSASGRFESGGGAKMERAPDGMGVASAEGPAGVVVEGGIMAGELARARDARVGFRGTLQRIVMISQDGKMSYGKMSYGLIIKEERRQKCATLKDLCGKGMKRLTLYAVSSWSTRRDLYYQDYLLYYLDDLSGYLAVV